jgi:hypothetical protein
MLNGHILHQFLLGSFVELIIQIVAVAAAGLGKAVKKVCEKRKDTPSFLLGKGFQIPVEFA